ncbi:MAG: hypothetical protein LBV38_02615, partial [Alistipes sp.]|nr:hypothetical protein [Alistipes sp.]
MSLSLPNTYDMTNTSFHRSRSGEPFMLDGAIEPDWSMATTWEYEGEFVTEVPAKLTRRVLYTVLVENRTDTVSLTTQAPHTRIRIVESPRADTMFSFVVTMLPDESYFGDLWQLGSNP